ncbi:MAG: ATP-binding protein [Rhodobacteraceae bacterium]|nr:ATP-binding protein [Paracoccaceae bacterium]
MTQNRATSVPWGFYGRETELARLIRWLEFEEPRHNRRFSATSIHGPRGVGKTHLVETAMTVANDVPVILFEVPAIADDRSFSEGESFFHRVNENLLNAAERSGNKDIRAGLPADSTPVGPGLRHQDILTALLQAGVVVVYDEFQRGAAFGLVDAVKVVIDRADHDHRNPPPGKIVLMGSHQQEFRDLFHAKAPLYQRTEGIVLHPWRIRTVLQMAAEHGILANPGRFLTLWTAYGGLPRHWSRYCTHQDYAHLHAMGDEETWRRAFLAIEIERFKVPTNSWKDKAHIELRPLDRDILLHIGRDHPLGIRQDRLHDHLVKTLPASRKKSFSGQRLLRALESLRDDLALLDRSGPFMQDGWDRWFITSNPTLFEITAAPAPIHGRQNRDRSPRWKAESGGIPIGKIEQLEGVMLERLAAEGFLLHPDVDWAEAHVWRPDCEGKDIDLMAVSGTETIPRALWLGEAKRDPKTHTPRRTRADHDAFIAAIGRDDPAFVKDLAKTELTRVLISPLFTEQQKAGYGKAGFACIDIHTFAMWCGIDPAPVPSNDSTRGDGSSRASASGGPPPAALRAATIARTRIAARSDSIPGDAERCCP